MDLNFSKTITKSGIPLWILNLPYANSVAVGALVFAGTRDEIWPQEAGIAHALEHMHFQGTENFPTSKHIAEYIEEIGGNINAITNSERTLYFSRVPVGYAERAVRVINEQIEKSVFPEEKIIIEMKNIVQEIKRRNDNPQNYLWKISNQFIYGEHPLFRDVLGIEESILKFTKNDFMTFKKRYYDPINYTFIIAGNISEEEALKLFNKYFTNKSKISSNQRKNEKARLGANKQFIENKELNQLHISLSALIGEGKGKSSLYLEFFNDMISGGMSFPLFQEVRDKRGLCYSIGSSVIKRSDVGRFDVYIGTDPKKYKEAIEATFEVIKKSKNDENLLNKVKNLKIGRLMLDYENTANIVKLAANDILFFGNPRGVEEIKKEIEEVTIENIKEAVNKYLKPELIFTTILAPLNFKENNN